MNPAPTGACPGQPAHDERDQGARDEDGERAGATCLPLRAIHRAAQPVPAGR
jgi:hypothetical protein